MRTSASTISLTLLLPYLTLLLLISGCQPVEDDTIQLRVISRNGLTTYYQDKSGPTGFEYELANRFAQHQGLELKIQTAHSLNDIFESLDKNQSQIAAAGLTITPEREKQWLFSPSYLDIQQLVIYNFKTHLRPKSPKDLIDTEIIVMANSSHTEILKQLNNEYPEIKWHSAPDVETVDLLDMVADGQIDYTIIDSNEFLANRGFYPRLRSGFNVGSTGELAWALPRNEKSQALLKQIELFFKEIEEDGTLQQLEERFYSHSEQLGQISTHTFAKAVDNKLPNYQALIEKTAQEYRIDWQLLAAISYQESHWNPRARSPTGVRGMMMLTRTTAREMKISDRLDAEQSLKGGAAYFLKIKKKLPKSVKEPDRSWFALAAYNIGLGHLKDVRKLTKKQGGDPNKWIDIKSRLPLLQKRRWYRDTRYGFARGQEALTYVQNIRHFYNYLKWVELSQHRTPPPKKMEQYLPDSIQGQFNAL